MRFVQNLVTGAHKPTDAGDLIPGSCMIYAILEVLFNLPTPYCCLTVISAMHDGDIARISPSEHQLQANRDRQAAPYRRRLAGHFLRCLYSRRASWSLPQEQSVRIGFESSFNFLNIALFSINVVPSVLALLLGLLKLEECSFTATALKVG